MAGVLVDTSAWIEFYHPRGANAVKRSVAEALRHQDVAVVAPIAVELASGAKTESAYETLQRDLESLWWLPLGDAEASAAGRLAWLLARAGRLVPTIDLLIAGAARVHACEVWHFGDAHFEAIASAGGPRHRDLKADDSPR
ncbi:MAG: PIN domain-containing protein [Gemmatimonadetes bacterium]|nr:PIN domain-containing protein [Gemmatimonadota bacterium]